MFDIFKVAPRMLIFLKYQKAGLLSPKNSLAKDNFGKERIIHVGYAKRTLENWARFSFHQSLSMNTQPFKEKNHCNLFTLPSVDFN